jgi:linoleoyl-CoA desaturase
LSVVAASTRRPLTKLVETRPVDRFAVLRDELQARGWARKRPARVVTELLLHLAVTGAGIAVIVMTDTLLARVAGLALSVLGSIGVGSNSHTSSHYATSDRRWVNETLTYFGLPFFLQLSATYWWHKHVARHHRTPNVVGLDGDIDFRPWFVVTMDEPVWGASALRRRYYSLQWLVVPFAISLNGFCSQLWGWRHLVEVLADPRRRRRAHFIDLALLLLHWVVWVVLPAAYVAVGDVVTFYVARHILLGYGFFVVLAPAHFPAEAVCVRSPGRERDFVRLQTATTVNFRTGPIGRFICSGLDYQIEHHLFPQVSHVNYPALSRLVREYCEREGYPYRTLGWGEGVWKSLLIFHRPKPVAVHTPWAIAGERGEDR